MPTQAIRVTILAIALAALPSVVAAQTSYGDKPQQPAATGTQTQPAAPMNKGSAPSAYEKALVACDQKPADQQQACRDAVDARFGGNCAGLIGSAKSDCLKNLSMTGGGSNVPGSAVRPQSAAH